jgi:hypothetical protein
MTSPQVHLIFTYGATLVATGIIPGDTGYAYQYATILTPTDKDVSVHLFKEDVAALCDAISEGLRESAKTDKVAEIRLPFALGR